MSGKYATEMLGSDEGGLARAGEILRSGGLVAVPTETVYGLAARADDSAAVARIYEAKGRPSFNPLIVHVSTFDAAMRIADFPPEGERLAQEYWPGPLTLVLPRRNDAKLAEAVTAGLETVAIRIPRHPIMRSILFSLDFPLAAPSANRSGFISPTNASHVLASLGGRIHAVVDGGQSACGLESTIVAVRKDGSLEQLRPGPLDFNCLVQSAKSADKIEAPGQLASHYAPGKPVRLDVVHGLEGEFHIGFGKVAGDCSLSLEGNLEEAASRLYACLHLAAESHKPRIAIAPVPSQGLGYAINDRLKRAATPAD